MFVSDGTMATQNPATVYPAPVGNDRCLLPLRHNLHVGVRVSVKACLPANIDALVIAEQVDVGACREKTEIVSIFVCTYIFTGYEESCESVACAQCV